MATSPLEPTARLWRSTYWESHTSERFLLHKNATQFQRAFDALRRPGSTASRYPITASRRFASDKVESRFCLKSRSSGSDPASKNERLPAFAFGPEASASAS